MSLGECKLSSFKGKRARDRVFGAGCTYTDVGSTIVEDLQSCP